MVDGPSTTNRRRLTTAFHEVNKNYTSSNHFMRHRFHRHHNQLFQLVRRRTRNLRTCRKEVRRAGKWPKNRKESSELTVKNGKLKAWELTDLRKEQIREFEVVRHFRVGLLCSMSHGEDRINDIERRIGSTAE